MASHVAHDVHNNFEPITLYLSLLRRQLALDTAGAQIVDKIESGFTALEATVNDLLHFTADREPARQLFDARELIHEIVDVLAPQLAAARIGTRCDVPLRQTIRGDREMIRHAILNLVLNAVDAMSGGGELEISVCQVPGGVELEVADSGPGIDRETRERIFDPFYSTKPGSTGLGLAIVDRIAAAHDGTVDVKNCAQGGVAFILRIPQRTWKAAA